MDFRHECKIEINSSDCFVLRRRLKAVADTDAHTVNGKYLVRSLYFDTPADKALREKIDGVNIREKFRIRYYNSDTGFIRLEKKSKQNGLCKKQSALLSPVQAQAIVDGDIAWMAKSQEALVQELYCKMKCQGLCPKTIVDYMREPFVFSAGNVRVTFDYNIRTGLSCTDFLNPNCITVPAGDEIVIMEVKWDEFLPDVIRDAISIQGRRASAFSKYARCRIYG